MFMFPILYFSIVSIFPQLRNYKFRSFIVGWGMILIFPANLLLAKFKILTVGIVLGVVHLPRTGFTTQM